MDSKNAHELIGSTVKTTCVDLDRHGRGIAKYKGCVLIVPDLLPSETAIVYIAHKIGSLLFSVIKQKYNITIDRREPICSVASRCGGCSLQHLVYKKQEMIKVRWFKETLGRIGNISYQLNKLISIPNREIGYRNRAIIPVKRDHSGSVIMGYYAQGTHDIVSMDSCPVLDSRIDKLIPLIQQDLDISNLPLDSDLSIPEAIRHICFRIGHYSNEILISILSSTTKLDGIYDLANKWVDNYPNVVGVTLNIQPKPNNILFGDRTHYLAGKRYVNDQFCGLDFHIATTNFFQVNLIAAEQIVQYIINLISSKSDFEGIVDAYSGIGTISLPLANAGFHIESIELNEDSVIQAKENASLNLITNIQFYSGDVSKVLGNILTSKKILIIDPPRKGIDSKVINILLQIRPIYIAYLSCDCSSLSRDLNDLVAEGPYEIEQIQPIDFFPQTMHLESLSWLKYANS